MNKAFTLVETLVVIVIIVILSLIVLPNYNSIKRQLALQRAVNKLSQDIRRAQEMTIEGREFNGSFPGYGIYLDESNPNYYILFADLDGGNDYDAGELIEQIPIESYVIIHDACPVFFCNKLTIIFTAPDPKVSVIVWWGTDLFDFVSSVQIKLSVDGEEKIIIINEAGLIAVE